jgi:hypothetical protein
LFGDSGNVVTRAAQNLGAARAQVLVKLDSHFS